MARTALERLLAHEGFHVQTAGTLQGGNELLDGQEAIILDLDLPDGNGVELLRKIRTEKRAVKVLVVTASDDPLVLREVRLLQPDALLCKPVDLSTILQHLDPQGGSASPDAPGRDGEHARKRDTPRGGPPEGRPFPSGGWKRVERNR